MRSKGAALFGPELIRLKSLARDFAEAVPALAPFLGGAGKDPDVERMLDSAAFQNELLGCRLRSDFPEFVRTLADLVIPHYLRPFPATTIIEFRAGHAFGESFIIPAGTQLASTPVDGTACRFTTTRELEIHPLELGDLEVNQLSAKAARIQLPVTLLGLSLSAWNPASLGIFLAGDRASAAGLFRVLSMNVKRIDIVPFDGGSSVTLPPESLRPLGFEHRERLLPYPPHAFPGYRLLQEYFHAPEKFLFLELTGWERWEDRGDGTRFTINFELEGYAGQEQWPGRVSCRANAVPAVNLFSHAAVPVHIDHRAGRHLVRPCGPDPNHHRVFSIDRVTGFSHRTGRERSYAAFELFGSDVSSEPVYHASLEKSPSGSGHDAYLKVAFPEGVDFIAGETLSIELTCTNGTLPDSLRVGDIRIPGPGLPSNVSFSNITPVNPGAAPPLGPELLRRLASHLYLNHATLGNAEHLLALLRLYLPKGSSPEGPQAANLKRIKGIEDVRISRGESMKEGVPIRGSAIRLKARQDHFAGAGDLYLFGCVLDRFFAEYSALNCFTRLTVDELVHGESHQWPMRQE